MTDQQPGMPPSLRLNPHATYPTPDDARGNRAGWNIRCNVCGSFGATWTRHEWIRGHDARPGWGALCLCPEHHDEWDAMIRRHADERARFQAVRWEQLSEDAVERAKEAAGVQ